MPRIAVIGLGRFGSRLARTVTAAGAEVIGIDRDREIIERLRDEKQFDSTDALVSQIAMDQKKSMELLSKYRR